jgi:RHS repeat-associated protein
LLQTTTYKKTPNFFGVDYTKKGIATKVRINYTTFGSPMPGRQFNANAYKYGFNGKENDNEIKGAGNSYDFGARIYDPRLGRFLSVDKLTGEAPMLTPYHFCSNAPVSKVDVDGNWDIEVHAFGLRKIFGYAILVVKDNDGNEVYRTVVRVHGLKSKIGGDRSKNSGDTPTGVYQVLNWQKPADNSDRKSYGPNSRLRLKILSGEAEGKRSGIALHGGQQENYDDKTDSWTDKKNPTLWNTRGCMRIKDAEIAEIQKITKNLEEGNPLEKPGTLTVTNDLFNMSGKYFAGAESSLGGTNPFGLKAAGTGPPPSQATLESIGDFFKVLNEATNNTNNAKQDFESKGIEDKK